jgi:hypothetical protein
VSGGRFRGEVAAAGADRDAPPSGVVAAIGSATVVLGLLASPVSRLHDLPKAVQ